MTTQQPISEKALIGRIRRKLAHVGEILVISRGQRTRNELGNYYIIDNHLGNVHASHCELEKLGREIGALSTSESVCWQTITA
jgi:hypothetical protein